MNKHELFHDIGEGVVTGGAVGLGIALLGMFFGKDEPAQQVVIQAPQPEVPSLELILADCRRIALEIELEKLKSQKGIC